MNMIHSKEYYNKDIKNLDKLINLNKENLISKIEKRVHLNICLKWVMHLSINMIQAIRNNRALRNIRIYWRIQSRINMIQITRNNKLIILKKNIWVKWKKKSRINMNKAIRNFKLNLKSRVLIWIAKNRLEKWFKITQISIKMLQQRLMNFKYNVLKKFLVN